MRKSPYRHQVKHHIRNGRPVRSYQRGKGKKPFKPTLRRSPGQSGGNFMVTIKYTSLGAESIPVSAATFPEAVKTATLIRRSNQPPLEVVCDKQ